jgi:hypothetical protein
MRDRRGFLLGIIIILFTEAIFFRAYLFTDILLGDTGDALLNNLIVEHWYQVFRGVEPITTLNIFYPITNTISYTDMLFGLSLPYSILRSIGLSIFVANKIMLISVHAFGALTYFYLLNRRLKLSLSASIIGCILLFSTSSFYNKIGHTQFFTIGYIPILLLFLSYYYEFVKSKSKKRFAYGMLSVFTVAFIIYTSWYVGFFLCLFSSIIIIILSAKLYNSQLNFKTKLIKHSKEIAVYFTAFMFFLIPFAWVYLPTVREMGSWNWDAVQPMLPSIYDFVNASSNNFFYGGIFRNIFFTSRDYFWELCLGFPFITFGIFLIASYYYVKCIRSRNSILLVSICLATLGSFLLLVKINGFSLWYIIFKLVPGGSAIRAASRYMFFLSIAVSFVVANFCDNLFSKIKSNTHKFIYVGIGIIIPCFLLMENMNDTTYINDSSNLWTISKQESIVRRVVPPNNNLPFFITDNKINEYLKKDFEYQLYSWLIANKYNLKTVNGYSGKYPPRWDLLNVSDQEYKNKVNNWMLLNNIMTLQQFDVAENKWCDYNVGKVSKIMYLSGWHGEEQWGCWTAEHKAVLLIPSIKNGQSIEISFKAHSFNIGRKGRWHINGQKVLAYTGYIGPSHNFMYFKRLF